MKNILKLVNYFFLYICLALCINHFCIVFLRYAFDFSYNWQSELSLFLNSIIFCGAAGYTYYYNNHVRVDVFHERLNKKSRKIIEMVGTIIFLLPMCLAIIYFSFDYIINSWKILEKSSEPSGIGFLYLFKTVILLFPITIILQAIKNFK
jgi:TRAP-type mannitol/chloroaromatic compound transport system permease small subunit